MQIICSHVNTDFDALASMLAAKKLYPQAKVVITDKQSDAVKQFLAIYRDTLELVPEHLLDWPSVTELILVDVATLSRIGDHVHQLNKQHVKITVYDHHPYQEGDEEPGEGLIEPVGATVTLLIEKIQAQGISITSFEATLFGLGIYTDTGSFTYSATTARDLAAASFLMEQGMNLEIIQRFSDQMLYENQQDIFNQLYRYSTEHKVDGLNIIISSYQQKKFQGGLATLTRKLLEMTNADAVLAIVEMQKRVYIVGRASSERINFLPLLNKWAGGGHQQAGSATIKGAQLEDIVSEVTNSLGLIIKPAITARAIMNSPVKTIAPEITIDEATQLMFRYGHTGFPIVKNDTLLGIISRRDLDKATHHGLGHAPVKAYMSTKVISVEPHTPLEEIQKIMITHDIGRIPVVEHGKLVGIISRTNIIEILHNQNLKESLQQAATLKKENNLAHDMKMGLSLEIFSLLQDIGETATNQGTSAYLIGGIVRDIILGQENDDIDIVVESDGIAFAKQLATEHGGEVITHEEFGTATWTHPSELKIDITSSRLEYYEHPAALPDVENSTLKEDLYRRDFTINAMAICLNQDSFGQLIDPFQGRKHLQEKTIAVLHNLSFVEDPTRILRAVRFESRFHFTMDEQTEELALISIDKIKALSAARVTHELKKLFSEANQARSLQRLFELRFWQQLGIDEPVSRASYLQAQQLEMIGDQAKWFMYFLIPFYQNNQFEQAKRFALTKQEGKLLKEVEQLMQIKDWSSLTSLGDLHRLLKVYSAESMLFYASGQTPERQKFISTYLYKRHTLPTYLTGEDLKEYGLPPSPAFAQILLDLEIAILNEQVRSKVQAIEWLKKQIIE